MEPTGAPACKAFMQPFLGPALPSVLPEVESSLDNDSFDMTDSQALLSRLQWDGSSDLSPSDSGSSKTSENQGWGLGR